MGMVSFSARRIIIFALAVAVAGPAFSQSAKKAVPSPSKNSPAAAPLALAGRQRAIHALNRLTFGPRPGDVTAVLSKGLDGWIEDQLHPESISEGSLNAKLNPYLTTRMDGKQLAVSFP